MDNLGFDRSDALIFFLAAFDNAVVLFVLTFPVLNCNFDQLFLNGLLSIGRRKAMDFICRRCNHITKQQVYRVITEDAGVVLLNMLVCSSCARLARKLGLPTVKVESESADKIERDTVMTDMKQQTVPA